MSDLLLRVKSNLTFQKLQQKVLKSTPKVTQAQIQKYYNENKSRYGVPETRTIRVIVTNTEAAAKSAKKEVQSGKSFASVAKKRSTDPWSKTRGGLMPDVSRDRYPLAFATAIFTAHKGALSGPVKTAYGYYVFKVLSSKPGSQQTLAQSQAAIKAQVTSTDQQTTYSKFMKEFKKKWKAQTDCRASFVVEDCKQYVAPKTPATTSSTPAATTSPGTVTRPTGKGLPPANVAQAVAACKSHIEADSTLSAGAKSKLEAVCEKAAKGDTAAVKAVARKICEEVIKKSSVPASAQQQALAACNKK